MASFSMDECTSTTLSSYLRFEGDGASTGDYTSRSEFYSSDPSVAFIGDGSSISPDGVVYPKGQLIAIKPGLATIRATYLDFRASIPIQIEQLSDLRIEPELTDIAEDLPQKFTLVASFSEKRPDQDASDAAAWSIEPISPRASVEADGTVQANTFRDDEPVTVVSRLPECGRRAALSFRVSQVAALELDYETDGTQPLPYGYTEGLRAYARFATPSSTRQNVTTTVEIDDVDDDIVSAGVVTNTPPTSISDLLRLVDINDDLILVTAVDREGTDTFDIHLDTGAGLDVTTREWTVANLDLQTVTVTPDELSVQYPNETTVVATGLFSGGVVRDITRNVTWLVSDAEKASVSTAADEPGRVQITNVDADIEITAFVDGAEDDDSDTTQLHIYSADARVPDSVQTP